MIVEGATSVAANSSLIGNASRARIAVIGLGAIPKKFDPLTSAAIAILNSLPRGKPGNFVFLNPQSA